MKNFFKKLSFVLASAMVITSLYAPANTSAAAKDGILLKGKAITKKSIFVGGDKINFDYKIGKHMNKGANGKWSVSDSSVIKVDKHGVVTAVGTGKATLSLKVKKNTKKGIKKNMTFKVMINALARASKLEIPASDKAISLKVGEKKDIMPVLTDKVDGVKNTYTLFAKSDNATDVAVSVKDNMTVVVEAKNATATNASISVFAAQKNDMMQAMNNKYKVMDSFTVMVMPNLEAKQAGAKTIKVMGADLSTDSAMYVLKNANGIVQNLKSVTVNTEKTEATLETYGLNVGKYTVVYNKNTELMLDVVKAVVASIEIMPEDKFVMNATSDGGSVHYKVLDQFGNDITKESATDIHVSSSLGTATAVKADKVVNFTNLGTVAPGLTRISLTLVDKNTGVNKTAVLTASNKAMFADATVKGIYDTKNKKFVENFKEDAKLDELILLVEAKDQYGNVYEANETENKLNIIFTSTNNLKADYVAAQFTVDSKKYYRYDISKLSSTLPVSAGKAELLGVLVNNGKTINYSFEVLATQKIDNIEVYAPGDGIFNKQDNELVYTIFDKDGAVVKDFDLIKVLNDAGNTTLSGEASHGKIAFVKDGDKVILKYSPTLPKSERVVLTIKTQTNKVKVFTLDVKDQRTPAAIVGAKSDAVVNVVRQGTLTVDFKKFMFQDKNGQTMTYEDIVNYNKNNATTPFGILVKNLEGDANKYFETLTNQFTEIKDTIANAPTVNAKNNGGDIEADKTYSGDLMIQLVQGTGSSVDQNSTAVGTPFTFKVNNVTLNDIKNLKIDNKEVYGMKAATATPAFTEDAAVKVKVVGEYNGKKIELVDSNYTVVGGVDNTGANTGLYVKRTPEADFGDKSEKTVDVQAVVNNSESTVLKATYKFKKEARKVVKVELKNAGVISDNELTTAKTFSQLMAGNFKLIDQYGEEVSAIPQLDGATDQKVYIFAESKGKLTVTNSGVANTGSFKLAADKDSEKAKVKIFFDSALVFDQEVTIKDN